MRMRSCLACVLLLACETRAPAPRQAPGAAAPRADAASHANAMPGESQGQAALVARADASAERHFGAPPRLAGAPLPVDALLAAPAPHLGKAVKCEGKVARVCERAGCWLELQALAGGEGLRVPMAGHAFFIPPDAVGHLAVVEGELRASDLHPSRRDHYQSEGMRALGPLALEATSVIVR